MGDKMYVIAVYDINEKRVNRILKLMRRYLHWQQRSVFEGYITESKYEELKSRCKMIIKEEDTIKFYILDSDKYLKQEVLGFKIVERDEKHFI